MPIGMPGCPDFAASTASIESARMAFAISRWETEEVGVLAMGVRVWGQAAQRTPAQALNGVRDLERTSGRKSARTMRPAAYSRQPRKPVRFCDIWGGKP
jgi:hypothetical protein